MMQLVRACQRANSLWAVAPLALMFVVISSCAPTSERSVPGESVQTVPGERAAGPVTSEMRDVAEDNNRFALELYARLRTGTSENLFFSPASLSTALAMAYAGARGQTAEQMADVLHFRLPQDKLHPDFGDLRRAWDVKAKESGYRLNMANRLWGQQGFSFLPGFLAITREHYGAELAQVDFTRQAEPARQQINAWVEEQTQGKIRDLVPAGLLDDTTRLVLTNAIYFKGEWNRRFGKGATQDAPFHVSARQQADVPLMYQTDHFRYWSGEGLKLLELPYGKGDMAMLILLPDEVEGLSALEAKLTADNLSRWQSDFRRQKVRVHLPRFTMTSQFQLDDVLKAMGMTLAFARGADLTGMSSQGGLYISAVIHKAFVDVNEEGTEAAAATAGGIRILKKQLEQVFRADHPFVFLIRDNRTGSILFMGRLVNPRG